MELHRVHLARGAISAGELSSTVARQRDVHLVPADGHRNSQHFDRFGTTAANTEVNRRVDD